MKDLIAKAEFFQFVVAMGVFTAMNMDWPEFHILNQTAVALLDQGDLLDEFMEYSQGLGIPTESLMPVGSC